MTDHLEPNHWGDSTSVHPLLGCADAIEGALKDVAHVEPAFMSTDDKAIALITLGRLASQVEAWKLRVLAHAEDVADRDAAHDPGIWISHKSRIDRAVGRRQERLAGALERKWTQLGAAVLDGRVNLTQAEVIVKALDILPKDLDPDIKAKAEEHLVGQASEFNPRTLRILGRRVLEVVAPEIADEIEGKRLEDEENEAGKKAFIRYWRRGDGTTDFRMRLPDGIADRFLAYLHAFTAPRKQATTAHGAGQGTCGQESTGPSEDRRSYPQRMAHAFGALLEAADPKRMPLHGGDATTMMVTIKEETLREALRKHGVALVGDEPISAAEARRLACMADIIPVVLGGDSQILDLGRKRRTFNKAQRKALAIRDVTCRAVGCDIPAAWCEAHHVVPWAQGGRSDLKDGALLCPFHHHRAHDDRYDVRRGPDGQFTFHRRH